MVIEISSLRCMNSRKRPVTPPRAPRGNTRVGRLSFRWTDCPDPCKPNHHGTLVGIPPFSRKAMGRSQTPHIPAAPGASRGSFRMALGICTRTMRPFSAPGVQPQLRVQCPLAGGMCNCSVAVGAAPRPPGQKAKPQVSGTVRAAGD